MDRVSVESSQLRSVGYEPTAQILEVEFSKGSIYQYVDVPIGVYEELIGAESVGKAFSKLVKSQGYVFKKL